jgi:hypothetical protein
LKESWLQEEAKPIDALFKHPEEYEERVVGFPDHALLQTTSPFLPYIGEGRKPRASGC